MLTVYDAIIHDKIRSMDLSGVEPTSYRPGFHNWVMLLFLLEIHSWFIIHLLIVMFYYFSVPTPCSWVVWPRIAPAELNHLNRFELRSDRIATIIRSKHKNRHHPVVSNKLGQGKTQMSNTYTWSKSVGGSNSDAKPPLGSQKKLSWGRRNSLKTVALNLFE